MKYTANDLPRYMKKNLETLNRIARIIEEDSISTISNVEVLYLESNKYPNNYETERAQNFNYLENELRKLNIWIIGIDEDRIIFHFELYLGFGIIKSKIPELRQPRNYYGEKINKFEKIYDNWYYFKDY